MRPALYVAAKAPLPGVAKTRLGEAVGHDLAIGLYRAFVSDLARRLAASPVTPGWYVTPDDAWGTLGPLVSPGGAPARVVEQGSGSWTDRQRRLFAGASARGEGPVVLIASDSPHVTVETVQEAFARLGRDDVVLGRVHDGGYYLLGMRGCHEVLQGVEMSTGAVADQVAQRAGRLGLSLGHVDATFDVDEAEDLGRLRAATLVRDDLPATRAALAALDAAGAALKGPAVSGREGSAAGPARAGGGRP